MIRWLLLLGLGAGLAGCTAQTFQTPEQGLSQIHYELQSIGWALWMILIFGNVKFK